MLELDNLSLRFGGVTALDRLSLTLGPGEVLGLVGANGAGKTTLFNVISGLLRPQSGRLRFQGRALDGMAQYRRARLGIGRTFQIPQPLQRLTVRENLLLAQRYGAGRADPVRIAAILEFSGLAAKADCGAAGALTLSELKALELARALATEPALLLLDEVLAGLETQGKRRLAAMLGRLPAHPAPAIIMIEHDLDSIAGLCPRVAVLDGGRLIADGAPAAVFRDPAVIASYTGMAGLAHA